MPSVTTLTDLANMLAHHGSDARGVFRDHDIGLVLAQPSSRTEQPWVEQNGRYAIVFDGELTNQRELVEQLTSSGTPISHDNTSDIVLRAYAMWGNAALAKLSGAFALALWDSRDRKLVLARDRFGERPLYVAEHAGALVFASEAKVIFRACPSMPRALAARGLAETFTFWSTVAPQTVFQSIEELRPAHVLTCHDGQRHDAAYWSMRFPCAPNEEFQGSLEDATTELRSRLQGAIGRRSSRADTNVGHLLSGGLDSSLVASLSTRLRTDPLRTFSLRYLDAELDESPFQQDMVALIASHHEEVAVSRTEIARVFPDVIRHVERPLLRTAAAQLFLAGRHMREHDITTTFSGTGADELFAGYDVFREGKVRRFWAREPKSRWRHKLLQEVYPHVGRAPASQRGMLEKQLGRNLESANEPGFAHQPRWESTAALLRLFHPSIVAQMSDDVVEELATTYPSELSRWSSLAQDQYIETRTVLSGYLLGSHDRVLAASGIQGRLPYLDNEVVAFACALPARFKLSVLDEKHILKRVARDGVSPSIVNRRKHGHRAADALAFLGTDAPGWVHELLSPTALREAAVFDVEAVRRLVEKCQENATATQLTPTDNMAMVGVLSTQLVHQLFIRTTPSPKHGGPLTVCIDRAEQR